MSSAWESLDDDALLDLIAEVSALTDPPPPDLAAGVISRLAAESLDFELLQLTESSAELSGVRSSETLTRSDQGSWTMSYRGDGVEIHLRVSRDEVGARLDGWLQPPQQAVVKVLTAAGTQDLPVDELGRFEWVEARRGPCQLMIERPTPGGAVITPPLWI